MTTETERLALSHPAALFGIEKAVQGVHIESETEVFWGGFQQDGAESNVTPKQAHYVYVLYVNGKRFTEEECRPHFFRRKQSWLDVYCDVHVPVALLPTHAVVTDPMLARFGDCLSIRADFHKAIAHARDRFKQVMAGQEPRGKSPVSQRSAED